MDPRAQNESLTEMTELVLPPHANALGTVFGGQIMAWADTCAAITAQRHSGLSCVTAQVDDLKFQDPVRIGEVVHLTAKVTATFRTSLEVQVEVHGEEPRSRRRWPCVTARFTFVALDASNKPTPIPALALDGDATRASQAEGEARRQARLGRRSSPDTSSQETP